MKITAEMPIKSTAALVSLRPLHISKWSDLPNGYKPSATYQINGVRAPVKGRQRAMLEGLMRSPIRASSAARLSDAVQGLRKKFGGDAIETILEDAIASDGEKSRPGFYRLTADVIRLH